MAKYTVPQYPNKKGQPGAGCPSDCPMDYLPAPSGGSTSAPTVTSVDKVTSHTKKYGVKQYKRG